MSKKIYSFFILLTAFLWLGTGTMRGDELTIADDTGTNEYVPVWGWQGDNYIHSQVIYPADSLTALNGKSITGMTFYLNAAMGDNFGKNFRVYLKATENEEYASSSAPLISVSASDLVFEGSLDAKGETTLTISFDVDFAYSGGNLLLDIQNVSNGGKYFHTYFFGHSTLFDDPSYRRSNYAYSSSSTPSSGSGSLFIPKTTFTYAAASSCAKPTSINVPAGDITSTSAKITWEGENNTVLEYKLHSAEDWTVVDALDATTHHTLTGLAPNKTKYDVRIKNDCGGEESGYLSSSFETACGAISNSSLPWSFGFEASEGCTTGSGNIPTCWDAETYTSGTTTYPYVYGYSAHSGSNCLYFGGGASGAETYIILPEFEADLKDLTLSFYYKHYSTSSSYPKFTVGYFATAGDKSTFVGLEDQLAIQTSYTFHEIDLKEVPTTVKNIVIRWAGGSYSYNGYLDDLRIIRTPSCAKPSGLEYSAPTTHGVTLSWTNGGSEEAWIIEYSTTSDFSSNVTSVNANSNPFTISTGMDANTVYYARVKASCGASEEDKSDWCYNVVDFRTDCDVIAHADLPWSYGFEDGIPSGDYKIPYCWQRNPNDNNIYVIANGSYSTQKYARTGTKSLKLYGGGSSNRTIILPAFADDFSTLTLEFYYKTTSTGSNYGQPVIGYVNTSGNFVSLQTLNQSSSYAKAEFSYPSSYEDTPAYIAIQYTGGSYDFGNLYIDDVTVKESPSCAAPSGLSKSAQTNNSATLSWTKNGSETSWNVQYSTTSDFSSDNHIAVANTNSSYVLSGLSANTHYYVHVQAACEGDYSNEIDFTTDCDPYVINNLNASWSEDFEGQTVDLSPGCWSTAGSTSSTATGYGAPANAIWAVYSYSSNKTMRLCNAYATSGGVAQIATQTITLPSTPAYELKFDYSHTATCGNFKVQISTDGGANFTDKGTYGPTIESPSQYNSGSEPGTFVTDATIDLSSYSGNIVIRFTANPDYQGGAIFIDNVRIEETPSCPKPTALNEATNITPEGATFSWEGDADYFQYICVAGGTAEADIDWSAATKVAKAATNQVVLSGKAAGTYDFYVRSWCSESAQSDALKKSFTTATIPAPTIGTITATNNSAHAEWTAPTGIDYAVQYQWSLNGTDWSEAITETSADITSLIQSTSYTFYVRSHYDATHQSAAAEKVFKTACDPIEIDAEYTESFSGYGIPDCWNNDEGTATYKWSYYNNGYSGRCVRYNSANNGSGKTNILASPLFALSSDAELSFYMKNYKGGDYKVQIAVDGGARQDLFTELTNIQNWTKKEADLSDYNGHTIQLFFCGTSNNSQSSDGYLYLDEFKITPVSCRKPASDPVVDSKDDAHATLTWTAGGTNTDYQFALALKDEAPVWETANVVSALTKSFENLASHTWYDFYVRTYCDDLNQSEARKVTFQTDCGVFALPFDENFDALGTYAIPECWSNAEGTTTTDSYKWNTTWTTQGRNNTHGLRFNSSTNDNGNTNILATPTIQLGEGNLLTFWAKNPTGGDFKVQIKEEGDAAVDLLTTGLTGLADWTLKYVVIPAAYDTKKVQILFHATSNEGDANAYIYIDDVRVARGEIFDDAANSGVADRINDLDGETIDFVMNRPMQFNGAYNTLCLPFDISAADLAETDHPLYDNTVKEFDYATIGANELQLAIKGASSIAAGVPCFVKFDGVAGNPRSAFLFKAVTIKKGLTPTVDGDAEYRGIYEPIAVTAEAENGPHHTIFVGADNQLYWPGVDRTMRGFRAYFYINADQLDGNPIKHGMPVRIVEHAEGTEGTEGIDELNDNVQSIKVLENDQVVIIRNGVKYTIQGQKIQ